MNLQSLPHQYAIGIDPGVKTGLAIWDRKDRKFTELTTTDIDTAWDVVKDYSTEEAYIVIEDPHLRTWFGKSSRERFQGAGSIKRDFNIWKKRLTDAGYMYRTIHPSSVQECKKHSKLVILTNCTQTRSSQHARDAAMIVWGM